MAIKTKSTLTVKKSFIDTAKESERQRDFPFPDV